MCEEPPFSFDLRIIVSFWCGGNCPTLFTSRVCGLVRLVRVCGRRRERKERKEREKEKDDQNDLSAKLLLCGAKRIFKKKDKKHTKATFRFWFFLLVGLVFLYWVDGFWAQTPAG